MGWTDFGADYTQASTITAGTLNTYNRDNLNYLKDHHDATEVHKQQAGCHVVGHPTAGVVMWGVNTAAGTVQTGEYNYTVTFPNTLSSVLAVLHSPEVISGSFAWGDECVRNVTTSGCTWHIRTWNDSGVCVVKGHVIVVGVL